MQRGGLRWKGQRCFAMLCKFRGAGGARVGGIIHLCCSRLRGGIHVHDDGAGRQLVLFPAPHGPAARAAGDHPEHEHGAAFEGHLAHFGLLAPKQRDVDRGAGRARFRFKTRGQEDEGGGRMTRRTRTTRRRRRMDDERE
eukprot:8889371-Pyramimonas_sp.AAC.1